LLENYLDINTPPPIKVTKKVYPLFEADTEIKLKDVAIEDKTFQFDNLNGTEEYAVYGWFRANS